MKPSSPSTLADIITALGGPNINTADIEWATDIDAGRKIVDWIAEQVAYVDPGELVEEENTEGMEKRLDKYRAALRDIALEVEEVAILDHFNVSLKDKPESEHSTLSSDYLPPSRLKKHAEHITTDIKLIEREVSLIHSRLRQTTQAMKKMEHTITSLRNAIERADNDNEGMQERLAELSIDADNAISSSVTGAVSLLDALGSSTQGLYLSEEMHQAQALSALHTRHTNLLLHAQEQAHAMHATISKRLPWEEEELQVEAGRLEAALSSENATKVKEKEDIWEKEELRAICKELEGGGEEALDRLMEEYERELAQEEDEEYTGAVDVHAELQQAWMRDQAAALDLRGAVLDSTLAALNTTHTPLSTLHASLTEEDARVREAEALLGALGEELEEVVDDLRGTKEAADRIQKLDPAAEEQDEILQRELEKVIKELKDLRPHTAPPLVLLNSSDILAELQFLFKQHQPALQTSQAEWVSSVRSGLNALTASLHPLLDTAYAHAPMHTSPPFVPPADVQALERAAKEGGDMLGGFARKLEGEIEEMGLGAKGTGGGGAGARRTERKLGAFVDKWCGPGK